jgi:hypothetical protein
MNTLVAHMTPEKFHKTRELIDKIMCSFDEVGSYCVSLVGSEVRIHYYLQVETVRHAPGTATITIKGQVLPRYAGPVKQLVEQKMFAYVGKEVKMFKVTKEEFELLDVEFPRQYKTPARLGTKIK